MPRQFHHGKVTPSNGSSNLVEPHSQRLLLLLLLLRRQPLITFTAQLGHCTSASGLIVDGTGSGILAKRIRAGRRLGGNVIVLDVAAAALLHEGDHVGLAPDPLGRGRDDPDGDAAIATLFRHREQPSAGGSHCRAPEEAVGAGRTSAADVVEPRPRLAGLWRSTEAAGGAIEEPRTTARRSGPASALAPSAATTPISRMSSLSANLGGSSCSDRFWPVLLELTLEGASLFGAVKTGTIGKGGLFDEEVLNMEETKIEHGPLGFLMWIFECTRYFITPCHRIR